MPLSHKQMEYLSLAWQCFETEPKIDYEKFRRVAGLASAHSARELMRVTKKKLREEYGAMSTGVRAANANTGAGGGGGTPKTLGTNGASPASGSRKRGRKPAATPTTTTTTMTGAREDDDEDDDEGGGMRGATPGKKVKANGVVKEEPKEDGFGGSVHDHALDDMFQ